MDVDDQGWDGFYTRGGPAPWEDGAADGALVEAVAGKVPAGRRVLEVGCGTGINAVALAKRGYAVTGLEIAPTALARAREAAAQAGVAADFRLADFVHGGAGEERFDAVVDRAVFHTYHGEAAAAFARQASAALVAEGVWVSVCGSCDDRGGPSSFPKVTMAEIVAAVEGVFEVEEVRRTGFRASSGHVFAAWVCVFRKRPGKPPMNADEQR